MPAFTRELPRAAVPSPAWPITSLLAFLPACMHLTRGSLVFLLLALGLLLRSTTATAAATSSQTVLLPQQYQYRLATRTPAAGFFSCFASCDISKTLHLFCFLIGFFDRQVQAIPAVSSRNGRRSQRRVVAALPMLRRRDSCPRGKGWLWEERHREQHLRLGRV
jgi:hypothetical protein